MDEHENEHENDQENEQDGAKPDELGEAGKKAIAAERKARKAAESELKELRAKVQEIEDKDKSEVERLAGQVKDLTKRAEGAEATVARYEVAAAKGLTPAQARRLVGSTKEELEEDADKLREDLGLKNDEETDEQEKQEQEDKGLGLPKEDLRDGASNSDDDQGPDPGKLADDILSSPF